MKKSFILKFGMRIIMVFIFFSLGISEVIAQETEREYVPFVEEGKVWYCGYYHPYDVFPASLEDPEGEGIDCIFTMCGDTLINGKEYKKVYCQFEEYYGDEEHHYYCAVREEDCRVFIIEEETTEEKMLYDFSHPKELVDFTCDGYKFARTEGWRRYGFLPGQLNYKICKYTDDEVDYSHSWCYLVDGAGTSFSNPFAFEFSNLLYDSPKLGKYIAIRSCIKDGIQVFSTTWMAMPRDPTSIDDIEYIDNFKKDTNLYDLQGRRLNGQPTKGIYIKNGKKHVIK